ncbi:GNAT family N-acetyltransferase [Jannaschia marina]|uniref:GNAT family N-acetyltransferase n=1 Tax=Jannaschia marina TaxID=2741674 RepID=UPI0015CDE70D|nr:GNAT family N-acetyltransferase [Jannaschia marina]
MILRAATEADRAAIVALHLASWQDSYGIELPEAVLRDVLPGYLAEKWAPRVFAPPMLTLVAEGDAGLAGFVCVLTAEAPPLIDNLHVHPGLRGRGLGARLLAAARAGVADAGFDEVELTVLERNTRAHAFYLAQGGRDLGAKPDLLVGHPVTVRRIRFASGQGSNPAE